MKNEILEEVWRARDQISAECGHDLKKLAAMLRRVQGPGVSPRKVTFQAVKGFKPGILNCIHYPAFRA